MNFEQCRVSDLIDRGIVEINDGYRMRNAELAQDGYPFLRVADVVNGSFTLDGKTFLSRDLVRRYENKLSAPGDVIVTTKGSVGRTAVVPENAPQFVYSPQVSCWRVRDASIIDSRFLRYWMSSDEFVTQMNKYKGQTSMADYFSLDDQRRLYISLPPYQIQQGVSEVLGALDDKIECNRRMNQTLEAMAHALYDHCFTGPPQFESVSITDFIEVDPQVVVPRGREMPFVEMKALAVWRMSVTEVQRRRFVGGSRFKNGDTLLAAITPSLENGKTAFVDFLEEDEAGFGSTEFIVLRAKENASPQFVYCSARDEVLRARAIKSMVGSSGRQRVRRDFLDGFQIRRFEQQTMSEFHNRTLPWFNQIRANVKENHLLTRTRDYLLPKLLNGEVEIRGIRGTTDEIF